MTADNPTLLLSHVDIANIVSCVGPDVFMRELISRLRTAIASYEPNAYEIPIRSGFHYSVPASGLMEWMPLHQKEKEVFLKSVGYHPMNPQANGLPTVISTLTRFDLNTGQAKTIADGALLTAMRTGAASAVATDLLADPEATELGLIGCGTQAVTQFHAISLVRNLTRVRVCDTNPDVATSFAKRVATILPPGIEVLVCGVDQVVKESSILCTATSVAVNQGPVFQISASQEKAIRPELHINAVGSDVPGKTELPRSLVRRSFVVPDFLEQALLEGECQQLDREQIGPSIQSVAAQPDRFVSRKKSLTVFDSTGWPLEDSVALSLALEHAMEMNIGTSLQLCTQGSDPWSPYGSLAGSSDKSHHSVSAQASSVQDESVLSGCRH